MTIVAEFLLSVGDGATSDHLVLDDDSGVYTVAWWDPGIPVDGERRRVVIGLNIEEATVTALWGRISDIEDKLRQARRAAQHPQGGHDGVTLGVKIGTSSTMVYFDVLDGTLTVPQQAASGITLEQGGMYYSGLTSGVILELECLPYARGDVQTIGPFTINEANLFTAYEASILGDRPARAHYEITDQSTTSHFLNRLRVAHKSQEDLDSGDWDGIVDCDAAGSATLQTSQADSIGGDYSRLASGSVSTNAWNTIATATSPTPAVDNAGIVDLWLRIRDHNATLTSPTNLAVDSLGSTGSLPNGTYKMRVVGLDGSGNESASSTSITTTLIGTSDEMTLSWDAPIGWSPSNYRFYWQRDTNAWKYLDTGSTSTTYNFTTESGATTQDPPSEVAGGAQWRVKLGLSSGTTLITYPSVTSNIGNGNWELLKVTSATHVPPSVLEEGGSIEQWYAEIEVNSAAAVNLDVDCLFILPTESVWKAEYLSLDLATLREWNIAQRRDGSTHGVLRSTADDSEQGQVSVVGPVAIGPNDTQIQFMGEIEDGVSNVDDLSLSVTINYVPLYVYLRGS